MDITSQLRRNSIASEESSSEGGISSSSSEENIDVKFVAQTLSLPKHTPYKDPTFQLSNIDKFLEEKREFLSIQDKRVSLRPERINLDSEADDSIMPLDNTVIARD